MHELGSLVDELSAPLIINAKYKEQLNKAVEDNFKSQEMLNYYETALEKCKSSYNYEQENYSSQILNIRTLVANYEKQIEILSQEKSEIASYREQIILLNNEISILKDRLSLLNKNKDIRKKIKSSSKISLLKHQAYKLQEKLKSCKFSNF